jgi:hypothetical protein
MPVISQFRGISIYMYTERDAPHALPHFHAYYGEHHASFVITPPGLLEGGLPRPQLRVVLAWAEIYAAELKDNWRDVQMGKPPQRLPGI